MLCVCMFEQETCILTRTDHTGSHFVLAIYGLLRRIMLFPDLLDCLVVV